MTQQSPPRWLEQALVFLLSPRDRETIPGDLLEEYRDEQVPRLGPLGANLWYLRQSISFLSIRSTGGPPMKAALTWISLATAVTGIWLAVMENILKHAGYGGRTAVAALIVVEALATVMFLMLDGGAVFRVIVLAGAAGIGALGISAIARNVTGQHFEGFVLIAGSLFIAQGDDIRSGAAGASHKNSLKKTAKEFEHYVSTECGGLGVSGHDFYGGNRLFRQMVRNLT